MSDHPPQNVVQATGAVATTLIEGLKGQPALLLILMLNVIIMGVIVWGGVLRSQRETLILERCLPAKIHGDANGTTTGGLVHE